MICILTSTPENVHYMTVHVHTICVHRGKQEEHGWLLRCREDYRWRRVTVETVEFSEKKHGLLSCCVLMKQLKSQRQNTQVHEQKTHEKAGADWPQVLWLSLYKHLCSFLQLTANTKAPPRTPQVPWRSEGLKIQSQNFHEASLSSVQCNSASQQTHLQWSRRKIWKLGSKNKYKLKKMCPLSVQDCIMNLFTTAKPKKTWCEFENTCFNI